MSPPTRRRSLLLATPAVAWAAVILLVSTRPATDLPATGVPFGDKLLHVAEYAVLAALLSLPLAELDGRKGAALLAAGFAFAVLDEAVQAAVPGRFADVADLAADGVGLLVGLAASHGIRTRFVPAAGTFM